MSKQLLVGLCGPAGCGKDTVAMHMVRRGFSRYAFASPIKAMVSKLLNVPEGAWDNREWKEARIDWLGKSPRELAQTLGTEWGRQHVNPDLWLRMGLREWDRVRESLSPRLVITDVRFENEALAIINSGGTVWRVERENVPQIASHVSEKGIPPALIEGVVKNNGSLDQLAVNVNGWLEFVAKRYAK